MVYWTRHEAMDSGVIFHHLRVLPMVSSSMKGENHESYWDRRDGNSPLFDKLEVDDGFRKRK